MCQPALGNQRHKTRQEIRCWALKRGHRETKSKNDPEHPEQRKSSTCSREATAVRFGFSGQGGKGEMSSVHSESISDKPASGPMLVHLDTFRKRLR